MQAFVSYAERSWFLGVGIGMSRLSPIRGSNNNNVTRSYCPFGEFAGIVFQLGRDDGSSLSVQFLTPVNAVSQSRNEFCRNVWICISSNNYVTIRVLRHRLNWVFPTEIGLEEEQKGVKEEH